jgi:tetratricopeptide (TPR) repeat protein
MKRVNYVLIFLLITALNLKADEKSNLEKADQYFQDGKLSLAEIFYNKALNTRPDNYDANYNLGRIYYFQDEHKKGIKYLQTAYDLQPSNEIMFHIGNCYAGMDQPEKAMEIYSNIIKKDPDYADTHLNAGQVALKQLYKKEITIANWEKFLVLRPNDTQASNIRKALEYLRDPNFVLKRPSEAGTPGTVGTPGHTAEQGLPKLFLDIKGKDLKSESEKKYYLKKKKGITTE